MHHTQYVANHEWPGKPEKFHLLACPEVKELERYAQRDGVVTPDDTPVIKNAPNFGYSDSREALVDQGFTACATCKP